MVFGRLAAAQIAGVALSPEAFGPFHHADADGAPWLSKRHVREMCLFQDRCKPVVESKACPTSNSCLGCQKSKSSQTKTNRHHITKHVIAPWF